VDTVAHELVHTFPNDWSSPEMLADCGKDYHNKDVRFAHGVRLYENGVLGDRKIMDNSFGIMSSGEMEKAREQEWITQCTYWNLSNVLRNPPDPRIMFVRGIVMRSGGRFHGTLLPAYDISGTVDFPKRSSRGWSVELLGPHGERLAQYPFAPQWDVPEFHLRRDVVAFHFAVPYRQNVSAIVLRSPQGVLDQKAVSLRAPEVRIVAPRPGASVTGRVASLKWNVGSSGGAAVLSTVLYSTDGGKNYVTVSFEQRSTSYALPLARGVSHYIVKIVADDSTRSSEATTSFFATPTR